MGGGPGRTGEITEPEVCDEGATDDPDAEFLDLNCDGIDGDRRKAIFVSPIGRDEDEGSPDHPVATLRRALVLAREEAKDVYVCTAAFPESLTLTDEAGPVRIYGGFACLDGWKRTRVPSEFTPPRGEALTIVDTTQPITLTNLRFVAATATEPGTSSVAARIVRAGDVTLDRVDFVAGDGARGADAVATIPFDEAAPSGHAGASAPKFSDIDLASCTYQDAACVTAKCGTDGFCAAGATECNRIRATAACNARVSLAKTIPRAWACAASDNCVTRCPTDDDKTVPTYFYVGGRGGNHYATVAVLKPHGPVPAAPPLAGKTPTSTQAAKTGARGQAGTEPFGELDADGNYVASNGGRGGKFGTIGTNSLSGGDGGKVDYRRGDVQQVRGIGGAGGSSGKPGCGGRPGAGGGAGGASIALVVVSSRVVMDRGSLTTGSGGDGGLPADGSPGQKGGKGGAGGKSSDANVGSGEAGSTGPTGGRGGPGGAGAAGPSVGIVFAGQEPELKGVLYDTGIGGTGAQGPSFNSENGADGLSQDTHEVVVDEAPEDGVSP